MRSGRAGGDTGEKSPWRGSLSESRVIHSKPPDCQGKPLEVGILREWLPMRCVACHAEIATPGRFCPECAAPLGADGNATETIAIPQKVSSSSSAASSASGEDGRFPAGTLLAERYRLISIVGRGGMGEVYRASDLKLNQPVALKFLPPAVAAKAGLLERFH